MRKIIFLLAILVSFVGFAQESPRPVTVDGQKGFFLSRSHMEYFYKTLQINELLETRKSECDTLVQSLERKNIDLNKRIEISDSICRRQEDAIKKKDEALSIRDEQIRNHDSVESIQQKKINRLMEENVGLNKKLEKEKPKKWWFGAGGFAAGVGLVLLLTL